MNLLESRVLRCLETFAKVLLLYDQRRRVGGVLCERVRLLLLNDGVVSIYRIIP
jgi:hypothetical protein